MDKKILIVEDDQFLREFYQELLQAEGYLVDVAGNREVDLQKAKGFKPEQLYKELFSVKVFSFCV